MPCGHILRRGSGAVEPGALCLARALDAAPRERPFTLRVVAPDDVMAFDAAGWETTDVVVVAGTEGLSRPGQARIAQFLEEGGGLLLVAGPDVDPRLVSNLLGPSAELAIAASDEAAVRRLAVADPRHPIFRPFGDRAAALGQVRFTGAVRVTLPDGDLLASFDSGDPALIEYAAAPGRALIFASDLNDAWNDFPRRAGFVPFVHEMVRLYPDTFEFASSADDVDRVFGEGKIASMMGMEGGHSIDSSQRSPKAAFSPEPTAAAAFRRRPRLRRVASQSPAR